jgi:hypothetical protein
MSDIDTELLRDPDSGLPLGSIVKNHRGEYGVIGHRKVLRVTKKEAEALMSSNPIKPAAGSTAASILTILQESNGYVSLGIQLAGVFVPLAKALIQKIEGIGSGNVTITFTDLVAADQTEIAAIVTTANADLAAVNAELVRMGLPPLPNPPAAS